MQAKAKILLVDDEDLVREELGGLLQDEGYVVVCAADAEQGLALFRQTQPDMVITDIRMPRADGLSLAVAIRQASPTTPVTIVTGHGTEEMAIYALRAGVTDFIKKPVRFEDLAAALQRMEAAREQARKERGELPDRASLLEFTWSYELENDLQAIPGLVDVVLQRCAPDATPGALIELSLALRELMLNAVEHGNLGLSYEDKAKALEQGSLHQLLSERSRQPPYVERRATLTATRRGDDLTVEIVDQGEGFDWGALPDPTDAQNILAAHGRGVLLAQMSVDRLTYSEGGTRVTIHKKLRGH